MLEDGQVDESGVEVEDDCSDFDIGMLSTSTGIAVTWLSGFGPLSFSLSKPLQFGKYDEREVFQFSLGRAF